MDDPLAGVLPAAGQAEWSCEPDGAEEPQPVHELPADPGGAGMFLVGLGCLGVVKLGRSARKLHFGDLPDWYHSGAPPRIGHTARLDPDFSTLTICLFVKVHDAPTIRRVLGLTRCLPCRMQFLPAATAPRAPPEFAHLQ